MGTKDKSLWIPTDANMTITVSAYQDLEDGDYLSEMAYNIASNDYPADAERREKLEEEIRNRLWNSIDDEVPGNLENIEYSIDWNCRTIEVCEWCESPNCDGDDCDDAPEWCDGCEEYTGGECDCVWCDECETYNCEVDHSTPHHPNPSMIFVTDLPINEDVPDVESML